MQSRPSHYALSLFYNHIGVAKCCPLEIELAKCCSILSHVVCGENFKLQNSDLKVFLSVVRNRSRSALCICFYCVQSCLVSMKGQPNNIELLKNSLFSTPKQIARLICYSAPESLCPY